MRRILIASNTYAFNIVKSKDLGNEKTYAFEMGYSGQLSKGLSFRCDSYFQYYDDMIGFQIQPSVPPITILQVDNIDEAQAYGAEFEISLQGKQGELSIWYAYNEFSFELENQGLRAFLPAKNKAGLSGRIFLPAGFVFNINYKYSDFTEANPSSVKPNVKFKNFHRLDLTLSSFFFNDKVEWLIGVSDLNDDANIPVQGIINFLPPHETPGRRFFTKIKVNF